MLVQSNRGVSIKIGHGSAYDEARPPMLYAIVLLAVLKYA